MNTTWARGLDVLAKTVSDGGLPVGELNLCEVAELLDKLLVGTGECPCDYELAEYMGECHGWDAKRQDLIATIYSIVDAVRTSDTPRNIFWTGNIVGVLAKEDDEAELHNRTKTDLQPHQEQGQFADRVVPAGSPPRSSENQGDTENGLPDCWRRALDIVVDVLVSAEEPADDLPLGHEPLPMQVAAAELFTKVIARLGLPGDSKLLVEYLVEQRAVHPTHAQAILDTYFLVNASHLECFWNDATLEFITHGAPHRKDG